MLRTMLHRVRSWTAEVRGARICLCAASLGMCLVAVSGTGWSSGRMRLCSFWPMSLCSLLGVTHAQFVVKEWDGLNAQKKKTFSRRENEELESQCSFSCNPGQYLVAFTSALGNPRCEPCPQYSSSPKDAVSLLQCTCLPGYTGNSGGPCAACSAGKYKDTLGSSGCLKCWSGVYSLGAASVCTQCEAGKYQSGPGWSACSDCRPEFTTSPRGSTQLANCTCSSGYTAYAGNCTACAAGKFKIAPGPQACDVCGAGTYADTSASACTWCSAGKFSGAESAECSECVANSISPIGSSSPAACVCGQGYYKKSGESECSMCELGKFKATSAVENVCIECEAGKYAEEAASIACVPCVAGKYQESVGQSGCVECTAGKTGVSAGAAAVDVACDLVCGGQDYANCRVCAKGSVVNGMGDCEACPAGWTTPDIRLVFPQVCTVPCNNAMLADQASSGCVGAWYLSPRRSTPPELSGCSEGWSCKDVCARLASLSCAQASLTHANSHTKVLAVARVLGVTCTPESCSPPTLGVGNVTVAEGGGACVEDAAQGGLGVRAVPTGSTSANLNPSTQHEAYDERGPCFYSEISGGHPGPGDCDAAPPCLVHRMCPCV